MQSLIGTMVVLGLSANEPTALLVVLVVLRSGRSRGVTFVVGWVMALAVVSAGAGFAARLGLGPRRGGPHRATLVIELVIGVAMVVWAVWYWLHHRSRARSVEVPRILHRLTSIGVLPAFGVGVITATYPPAIVVGSTLLRSPESTVVRVAGLVTFLLIGPLMVMAPVIATYAAPTWTARHMDSVFRWTLFHRRNLLTLILTVVGVFIATRAVLHLAAHH